MGYQDKGGRFFFPPHVSTSHPVQPRCLSLVLPKALGAGPGRRPESPQENTTLSLFTKDEEYNKMGQAKAYFGGIALLSWDALLLENSSGANDEGERS